jgi:TRAP-type C4-dicarboxylate transport system permease small subunit
MILRLVDRLNAVMTAVVGVLLALITIAILVQVLVRFVLTAVGINISAPWTEELARYLLIWMVFLGAGIGCRRAQLIALDFLVRKLPSVPGQALRYATILLCVAFFALLFWIGLPFVELGRSESSPVMVIAKSWVYWAMPVGAALMIVNSLALMAEAVSTRRDIRSFGDTQNLD